MLEKMAGLTHLQIDILAATLIFQGLVASLPEEIIILSLGYLVFQGRLQFFEAFIVVYVCLSTVNSLTVFLGNKLGYRVLTLKPFCWLIKKPALDRATELVKKNGSWAIFLARFTPFVRGPVYWAFGVSRVPVLRFMRIDMTASLIYVPALLLLGGWIAKTSGSIEELYKKAFPVVMSLLGMLILFFVIKHFAKKRVS